MFHASLLVPTESVEDVLSEAVGGRNEHLRAVALWIAARRWPDGIVAKLKNAEFGPDGRAVAAILIELHPSREEEVRGIMDSTGDIQPKAKNPWLNQLRRAGPFGLLDHDIRQD